MSEDSTIKIESAWGGLQDYASSLVRFMNPKIIVDLGVFHGFSTLAFASECKHGVVYGVDDFRIKKSFETCKENLEKLSPGNIAIVKNDTIKAAEEWHGASIDILHIDAGHSYENVNNDFEAWEKFLNKNGVVLLHDVNNPAFSGPLKVFNDLEFTYKIIIMPYHGLGILTDNLNIGQFTLDFLVNNDYKFVVSK